MSELSVIRREIVDPATVMALINYSEDASHLQKPEDVLNTLHDILCPNTHMRVLGVSRFPVKTGDWRRIELGRSVLFHKSVPKGWVDEWIAFVKSGHPLGLMWTELSRLLDPVGIDRWPFELAHKHGMRDGFLCPIGARWVVGFWSPRVLNHNFTLQCRGLLHMAAGATAVRLDKLLGADIGRVGTRAKLTPRELTVLRHASDGRTTEETANMLGLGPETVRSHMKKAEAKLGTRNRTHTVAEAMRQLLII